jgi:predicted PhzF superfamily epimerase YddE/YHI9
MESIEQIARRRAAAVVGPGIEVYEDPVTGGKRFCLSAELLAELTALRALAGMLRVNEGTCTLRILQEQVEDGPEEVRAWLRAHREELRGTPYAP